MKLCNEEYIELENRIKEYYQRVKLIKTKEMHLKELEKRLERLERDISNVDIVFRLNPDLRGVIYDKVHVTGGQLPCSDMDRQIENIYAKLEQEKEQLINEILLDGILILDMKKENDRMEQALSMLSEQAQEILYLRFYKKCSYEEIANKLPISKSNVSRKIEAILHDILLWIDYVTCSHHLG